MNIVPPADAHTTRPITDRVKEALFSILQYDLPDAYAADLFCGTGSMGLEALSRGAAHAIMADFDADAVKRLRENIAKLRFQAQTTVVRTNIYKTGIPQSLLPALSADETAHLPTLVFVDPPYRDTGQTDLESKLGKLLLLIASQTAAQACVVVRQEKHADALLDTYDTLHLHQIREYGTMKLSFLRKL